MAGRGLYFIVGALVVVVAGLGWYVYTDQGSKPDAEISIDLDGE